MTDDTQDKDLTKTEIVDEPDNEPDEEEELGNGNEDSDDEDGELGGSMTFLEHLGELRERLIRALVAFAVCVAISFIFSENLLQILMAPLPEVKKTEMEKTAELWKLALEARQEIIVSATGAIIIPNATETIAALDDNSTKSKNSMLQSIHPFEGILAWVKVSIIAGIFLAFPIIFYQAWMFIAPGLYKRERKLVLPLVGSAWFCFILGGCFCYFVIYSFILDFLVLFNPVGVEAKWSLSNYIATTTRFMLAFGLIFEEPVVITLLAKIGIVNSQGLGKFRPYAIVCMFALSALITPPDPFSQMACALPLYLLYEISIVIVRMIERGRPADSGEEYAG